MAASFLRLGMVRSATAAARTMAPALTTLNRFAAPHRATVGQVRALSDFKDDYDGKVAGRAADGLVMTPLNPAETADLVEQLKVTRARTRSL